MNGLRIVVLALSAAALIACDSESQTHKVAASSTRTSGGSAANAQGEPAQPGPATASTNPHSPGAANTAAPQSGRHGEVVETMDASSYTYALVKTSSGNVWIAGPQTDLEVGDQISFPEGALMEKFRSDTLDREFARIYFVGSIEVMGDDGGAAPVADVAPPDTSGGIGTVKETMDAGGYTYALLEMQDGAEKWVAGPLTKVAVGQDVGIVSGDVMEDFRSPTLDRTFDSLELVPRISVLNGDDVAAQDPGTETVPGVSEHTTAKSAHVDALPTPEGGVTIADIHEQKEDLAGKEVILRGKVVKFNADILNANWIHIQDGSGDPAAGTHDITITTGDPADVGDVVLVKGKVALDKDFGAGYRYPVMVEEATVTVEP